MSNVQISNERTPHDLGRFVFTCGDIGRLKVLDTTLVQAGDSYEANMVGAFRLSPLRRGLVIDSKLDVFTFYVPHRHSLGDTFVDFMKAGYDATPLPAKFCGPNPEDASFLGTLTSASGSVPEWLVNAYMKIYNNYFKMPSVAEAYTNDPTLWTQPERLNGLPCCHLKNVWTASLPENLPTQFNAQAVTDSNVEITTLAAAYGRFHTEQERALFAQRYRDVVEMFGGSTTHDADSRPTLLTRTEQWASGYDVDGTDSESLGQFSGRVQQSLNHRVPRFFVPEHGAIITVCLPRFPPIHTKALPFYIGQPNSTYEDISGDPAIVGNLPVRPVELRHLFVGGSATNKLRLAESQWLRSMPDYVDPRYTAIEGFPFMEVPPNNVIEATYIAPTEYTPCFQTDQLHQWNMQLKTNVVVLRNLPTTRDSVMTS